MTIKSKIHEYGNEHESEWPPQFGTRGSGHFYFDKEKGVMVEGYPPDPNPKCGEAPMVMFDSMPPQYHEDAGRVVDSRKEWNEIDKANNRITFGSRAEVSRTTAASAKAEQKALKEDRRKANVEALKAYRENPAEAKAVIQKRATEQTKVIKKAGMSGQLDKAVKAIK